MGSYQLVGRDAQLDAVRAWLGDPARLPSSWLVEGEPGIGKTSLMSAVVAEGARLGYRVLEASPAEPETGLAYAALGDLLSDALDTVLPELPEPQQVAVQAALMLRPARGHRPEALAVATAFLNALRALSTSGPVLIVIDDAQWLDAATKEVLHFALRRLKTEHVAVACSRRSTADHRIGLDSASMPSPTKVALGPLTIGAIHVLVREQVGLVLSRPTLRRLFELSGGNPFYALEIGRALDAGRLDLGPGGSLPRDLQALVDGRIADLPQDTRRALAACAAMSRPTTPMLANVMDAADATTLLAPAIRRAVVHISGDDIAFDHPLLASAAYAALGPLERQTLHARLATTVPESQERARHLALSTNVPNEQVAAVVEAAAAETFARAAGVDAAELAALALRLTPDGELDARRRRTFFEAYYRFESGAARASSDLLEGLIQEMGPGPERGRVMAALARVRHFQTDVSGGVALQRQALTEAGADTGLRGALEESIAEGLLLMRSDVDIAHGHARSAVAIAEERADKAALAEALAVLALAEQTAGMPTSDAMERSLDLEAATLDLCVMRQPSFAFGSYLASNDQLEQARDVLLDLRGRADDRGNVTSIAPIRNRLATVWCLLGDLTEAERLARESEEFALQNGQLPSRASALGRLALVLARQGAVDEARDAAGRSLELAGGPGSTPELPGPYLARGGEHALWAMGEIALSVGDPVMADRYLGPLAAALTDAGVRDPGDLRFLLTEVEALTLLGRLDDATRLTSWLEAQAVRLPRASVHAAAHAARGIVHAGRGDLAAAIVSLAQAVEHAQMAPLPFELGRILLLLGRVQRRAARKRDARASLDEAAAVFEGIGARRWAAAARDELRRIGGRAPSQGRLSDTEQRVANLVTRGMSNKEVAAALFVTPKAVEANLSRVYAKTGVRSRAELAALVTSQAGASK